MEIKWGLIPDMSGSVSLRELLPMDVAKELTMTGREFDGNEAKALNLVTGVSDDPLAAAEALAAQIKSRSPDAIAASKALFEKTWLAPEGEALGVESKLQFKLLRGKNQREAMKANFEKRAPAFKKRQFDF
jgi:enoyl-CoA hydratase/carnithine racemase